MSLSIRPQTAPQLRTVAAKAPAAPVEAAKATAPVKAIARPAAPAVKVASKDVAKGLTIGGALLGAAGGGYAGFFGGGVAAYALTMTGLAMPWAIPIGAGLVLGAALGGVAGGGLGKLVAWAGDKLLHH